MCFRRRLYLTKKDEKTKYIAYTEKMYKRIKRRGKKKSIYYKQNSNITVVEREQEL